MDTKAALLTFVGIVLGLVYRTVVPYIIAALQTAKETGEWPRFLGKFWVPPVMTLIIEFLLLVGVVFSTPGMLAELGRLGFLLGIAFGIAGQSIVRDAQKAMKLL